MTWRKTGSEFDNECSHIDLSDAGYRTHNEAIGYVYSVEAMDCQFPKRAVRKFASSDRADEAIKELCDHGFWRDQGDRYEVVHHADVIRQSLVAQQKQRATSKETSARHRARKAKSDTAESTEVTESRDASRRQTDRQASRTTVTSVCTHGISNGDKPDSWFRNGMACEQCAERRAG